jgi:AcrR family transcriptional regulator
VIAPSIKTDAEQNRRSRLVETRRAMVLEAAKEVFEEEGLDGASIRAIAKKAGYTPGAIYSYFPSKEAIYAALLSDSLVRLRNEVLAAVGANKSQAKGKSTSAIAATMVMAKSLAWFNFYSANPKDLDLGFYLFKGMQPRGLSGDLNTALNAQLLSALEPAEQALRAMGLTEIQALRANTNVFAHGVGLLLLQHTGRIRIFEQDAVSLFTTHLRDTCEKILAAEQLLAPAEVEDLFGAPGASDEVEDEFLARQKPLF